MNFFHKIFGFIQDDDYEEAIRLYNMHLYAEAIARLENVLKKKSSRSSIHNNLAESYCYYAHRNMGTMFFVVGNFAGALEQFNKALGCAKKQREPLLLMGICQNNLGEFETAAATFSAILQKDPENSAAKLRLGIALLNLKLWNAAITFYATMLSQKRKYADVHFRLGLAYLGQNKADRAIVAFRQAISINAHYVEAHIKLGLAQAHAGDFDGALACFALILERHPDFADIHYARAVVLAGSGRIQQAQASFEKALEINPAYKDARIRLGILHCAKGEHEAAAACLRDAGKIDPLDINLKLAIAAVASIMACPAEAKDISGELERFFGGGKPINEPPDQLNSTLKINPDIAAVLAIIREFSEDAALCEMLVPVVQEYVRDQPTYPDMHNALGGMYLRLNKIPLAEEAFRQALRINPEYLKARVNLFNALRLTGNLEQGLEQGELIIGKNVHYPDIYCGMGEILIALDRHEEALGYLEKTIQLRLHYGKAHYLKAQILTAGGKRAEAELAYEACLSSYPPVDLGNSAREALNALRQKR